MHSFQEIASLISVRDNLNSILNGYGKLSKEEKTNIQNKINLFDKTILEWSLKIDLEEKTIRSFSVSSTEDTETVMKRVLAGKQEYDNKDLVIKHGGFETFYHNEDSKPFITTAVISDPAVLTQTYESQKIPPFKIDNAGATIITTESVISHNNIFPMKNEIKSE